MLRMRCVRGVAMTLAIAITLALFVVGLSVGLFLWAQSRALAEAAQFVPVSGLFRGQVLELRVALPPTCSLWRFTVCLRFAVDECARLFGERAVELISGTRCAVHFSTKWRDNVTGQMVAGTALHGEVRVGADLAALCHELVHVCQERAGLIDETHASWTPEIYAAIERYEAFARTVRA